MGMVGTQALLNPEVLLKRLGWEELPKGSVCVDVGGGVGTQTLLITKTHPHLKMVVQDQAELKDQAEEFWATKDPQAIPSGRVEWQAVDFFKPQPIKGAAVYFLRGVVHDWPDDEALQILQQVRAASSAESKLIIIDHLMSYACSAPSSTEAVALLQRPEVPKPLLNNLALVFPNLLDATMMSIVNSMERTIEQWLSLTKKAGFKIDRIVGEEGGLHHFICLPL